QFHSGEWVFDVSDARFIQTGVIHVEGAAANGWAELMLSSTGGWQYKGSMRSTGALSYDVLMVTTFDLQPFGGPVLTFTEKGDVEGTLVLGGNRAHVWDQKGMDDRIKNHWDVLRTARATTTLTVDFGPGDVLALVATVIGVPLAAIAMLVGGAWFGANHDACGYEDQEYYDPYTQKWERGKGVTFVPKGEPCPPGTHRSPRQH
ncbi:MAG TPA: hypothetical protein VFX28_08370, partial [Methylomirabilota bacterium]|nr:hypothetical protein [Methylomirabilota bacterium]